MEDCPDETTRYPNKPKGWRKLEARRMRKNPTMPEYTLWQALKRKQFGVKFRRQSMILGYIADFYCPSAKLVVEVDGPDHNRKRAIEHDRIRSESMASKGIKTIRFTNGDVMCDLDRVVKAIQAQIEERRK
jgi:very-short-patch-repair endonuclease